MNKRDILLIFIVLAVAAGWWGFSRWTAPNAGALTAQVWQDKVLVGEYPLASDTPVTIPLDSSYGHNAAVVENGAVRMTEADCPDQVCVHTRAIDSPGETIVCLPNRVVIEIKGNKESPIDDLSQ